MHAESKVLIADGEENNRRLLEVAMAGSGHEPVFAQDGESALRQAEAQQPEVILLDASLPKLDGFEVCRRLRAHPDFRQVAIIFLVAREDHGSKLTALAAGGDDFITKPLDEVDVRARLQTITRLSRQRRSPAESPVFHEIAEQSVDGYLQVDRQDQVLYANAQARRYLGLPLNSGRADQTFISLARESFELQPPEAWQHWPQNTEGNDSTVRYLFRPPLDSVPSLWLQARLITPERTTGRWIHLRDVTEQLTTQRAIWRFHATLSRKLAGPFGGLVENLDYLAEAAGTLAPADMGELAIDARNSASHLQKVLSWIAEPRRHLELGGSFCLADLEACAKQIAASLGINDLTTALQTGLDSARLPLSDVAVEILLGEIFENSKKLHPRLEPALTVTAFRPGNRQVALRIADDGPSLPRQQLEQRWALRSRAERKGHPEEMGGPDFFQIASLVWELGGECRLSNREPRPGMVVELSLPEAA